MADLQAHRQRDLVCAPAALWLWCLPAAVAIAAGALHGAGVIALPLTGLLWVAATAWMGAACLVNARGCGRVHCRIDGVLFPLLALAGMLDVAGVISFPWNAYWAAFAVILAASFLAEKVWATYA